MKRKSQKKNLKIDMSGNENEVKRKKKMENLYS